MVVLLIIIYIAFISLGLPDAVLGSAWPVMYEGFGVPIGSAGIISMIVAGGTIVSSLLSDRLIRKLGTGLLTLISVAMTAAALLGISFAGSFWAVCLLAVPLGLGAGSVDAGLNNFVALHYKALHMNWLHSFWGLGTIIGPVIISGMLARGNSWNNAYLVISLLQFALVAVLVFSLPLWKKAKASGNGSAVKQKRGKGIGAMLALPRAKPTLIAFFCYCALEQTVMLWGASFLVVVKHVAEDVAAGWIALFFVGITLGRFLSGFLSLKLVPRQLIRLGQALIAVGVLILLLPLPGWWMVAGLFFVGLGCAPIYPSIIHETPNTFGAENSQAVMGVQMASAYVGTVLMPPLFGLLGSQLGYGLFPFYLAGLLVVMAVMSFMVYRGRKSAV